MTDLPGLRGRKKEATRQTISNVATLLFIERGFDNVSVSEIADAADVARKTVFNYFPRKEDLVFDREEEVRTLLREALAGRGALSPIAALQRLLRALVVDDNPLLRTSDRPIQFWRTVSESTALSTRARELQVTLSDDLAGILADAIQRPHTDPEARLAAAMAVNTLVIAYGEAMRVFRENGDATAALVAVMDRGFAGIDAAMAGTDYL